MPQIYTVIKLRTIKIQTIFQELMLVVCHGSAIISRYMSAKHLLFYKMTHMALPTTAGNCIYYAGSAHACGYYAGLSHVCGYYAGSAHVCRNAHTIQTEQESQTQQQSHIMVSCAHTDRRRKPTDGCENPHTERKCKPTQAAQMQTCTSTAEGNSDRQRRLA